METFTTVSSPKIHMIVDGKILKLQKETIVTVSKLVLTAS